MSRLGRQLFYAGLLLAMAGAYAVLTPLAIGKSIRRKFSK